MPTARISTIFCVQQATGTDMGVNDAIASLPEKLLPPEINGVAIVDAIRAIPGVISAIDAARSDPDNLYITTVTQAGNENAIWPGPGQRVDVQAGQSFTPNLSLDFTDSQNISLWDHDSPSDDDLLGSVTMLSSEQGVGEIAKLARSQVESSAYYVVYRVD